MPSSLTDVVVERDPFFSYIGILWYLSPPLDVPGSIYKSNAPICLDLTLGLAVNSFSHRYCERDKPGSGNATGIIVVLFVMIASHPIF